MIKNKIFLILTFIIIFIGVILLLWFCAPKQVPQKTVFGVTFSKRQAKDLNLDWKKLYIEILDDLKVKHLRIPAYWDEIQPKENQYNFKDLDWQINEAKKRNVDIILVIGRKQPRWPECFIPNWASSDLKIQRQQILNMLEKVIRRYKYEESIWAWQIENEPLFHCGICPEYNKKFLDKEISLAKSLDTRPIIITDSGEFSLWVNAGKRADILGTSLYRIVRNKILGYISYEFIPASFYQKKAYIIKKIFPNLKDIIIIELQAEPWVKKLPINIWPIEEQFKTMDFERFNHIIEYGKKVGYSKTYLWGVEWWAYLRQNNHPEFWEKAKEVFRDER